MIAMKRTCLALAFVLAALWTASDAVGEEVQLRLKLHVGDILVYKASSSNKSPMSTEETTQVQKMKVKSVEGDVATVEMVFTKIKAKSVNMMGTSEYDSEKDKEATDTFQSIYKAMVNKPFTVKIDTRGKVLQIEGWSGIADEIVGVVKKSMGNDPRGAAGLKTVKDQFGEEAMAKRLAQAFLVFPKEAVPQGGQWMQKSEIPFPMLGDLELKQTNTLDSIAGDDVTMKFSGTLKLKKKEADPNEDPQMAQMRQMMQVKGGKVDGTLNFDRARGLVKKQTRKQTMTMAMMGREMTSTDTSTLELVEFKPGG